MQEQRSLRKTTADTVLPYVEIKAFSPKERDRYIQNVILRILQANSKGVTVAQVSTKTNFSRPTVAKHLDILVAIGEAYRIERGNLSIYYKNGKILREIDAVSVSTPDKTYTFYVLENEDGEFVYIQEKELDEFRSVRVRGGVMINKKDLALVIGKIQELFKETIER